MSMDVSRLAIEVTTTGIKEASTALGGLSRSAGGADAKVQSLTANLAKLMMGAGNATGVVSGLNGTMALINNAMQSASASATAMAQALATASQGMSNLTSGANSATNALREKNKWAGTTVTTLKAMAVAASAYLGFNFAKHSIEAADAWIQMGAKLKIATGSMENAKVAQEDLFQMAQKLRAPLDESVKLFTRMAPIMRQYGKSYQDTKDVVEGVSLALKLNGATTAESASVMLQFSQAMQKGKLDGQEFNAVASNAGILMRALAEYTGKSQAELATLRSKGFITVDIMQKAIAATLPKWRADFASLPITVEDAWQRIKNAWLKGMGEISGESGLNKGLADTLAVFESLIPTIRDELIKAFVAVGGWINQNREGLGEIWLQVKGLVGDVWNIASMFGSVFKGVNEATDGVSMLGLGIFTVRAIIATVVDIVKVVAQSFVLAGNDVVDFFLAPMYIGVKVVEKIAEGIGFTMELLAKGADAMGMTEVANTLRSASKTTQGFADSAADLGKQLYHTTDASREMAMSWTQGKSELDKVLDGATDVNLEVKKTAKLNKDAWDLGGKPLVIPDPKAIKEHEKAVKSATSELNKMMDTYKELAAQSVRIDQFGLSWDKLSKSEKDVIVLTDLLARTTDKQARSILQQAINVAQANAEMERMRDLKLGALKADEEYGKKQNENIDAAQKELDTINAKIAGFDKLKGSVDDATLAEARRLMMEQGDSMTDAQIKKQLALIAVLEQVQTAKATLSNMELGDKVTKELDALKGADFGSDFSNSFGKIGKAVDAAGKSLDQYNKKMTNLANIRKEAAKLDPEKRQQALAEIQTQELMAQVNMYADLAGAAKSYFDEGTTGYKVLSVAEKAFRVMEMALAFENYLKKMGLIDGLVSAQLIADAKTLASTVMNAGQEIAANMGAAQSAAVAGVANQAKGDPYSAFFRMAAMAAIMAGLGLAVNGGGGGKSFDAKAYQATQGTGTVLGDSTAKSESISKSLDRLKDNSNVGLEHTANMVKYLRDIDAAMSGLAVALYNTVGVTSGNGLGIQTGVIGVNKGDPLMKALGIPDMGSKLPIIGGLVSKLQGLWGKTKQDITDSGLALHGTVGQLSQGQGVQQYADVSTTKSSFFGLSKSTSTNTVYGDAGSDISQQFGRIFGGIAGTLGEAATTLGKSGQSVSDAVMNYVVDIPKASLRGLQGDDLKSALNAIISSSSDQIAHAVLGGYEQFQQVGEGYLETIVRVANGYELAKASLENLGVTMEAIADVRNKQGDVAAELVRDSIAYKEYGTSVGSIIDTIDGSAQDLITTYKQLVDIRSTLKALGMGNDVSRALIRGNGGSLDSLTSDLSGFIDSFYTDTEKAAISLSKVKDQFAAIGVQMPSTKDGFRTLVQSLMAGGDASQETAGRLLALSGSYSDAMDEIAAATSKATDEAKSALKSAYDAEAGSLQDVIDKMKQFSDSLKAFRDSLIMGDMSTKSVMEKYQTALANYNDISAKAQAGDETAIGQFQTAAEQLLSFSRQVNASGSGYTADYDRVLAETQALQQFTETQADAATQSLDLLKQQVGSLIDINDNVKTVAQAMAELLALMGGDAVANAAALATPTTASAIAATAPVTDTSGAAQTAAATQVAQTVQNAQDLVAEVKALHAEVTALRQEAKVNAEAVAAATYDANDRAAQTIVAGYSSVQQNVAYYRPIPIA